MKNFQNIVSFKYKYFKKPLCENGRFRSNIMLFLPARRFQILLFEISNC